MGINPKKQVLLLGAGFSKDVGGFLASELCDKLINDPGIKSIPKLREQLWQSDDFEEIYNHVVQRELLGGPAKQFYRDAIIRVYNEMDQNIQSSSINSPVDIQSLKHNLIDQFMGGHGEHGFIFTLNQDLMFERLFFQKYPEPTLPCIIRGESRRIFGDQYERVLGNPVDNGRNFFFYDEKTVPKESISIFNYIKLHGSMNLVLNKEIEKEYKPLLISGRDKRLQLKNYPLLGGYLDIFDAVFSSDNLKLLIIGYGFGDDHINETIKFAAQEKNLKIFIISPEPRSEIKKKFDRWNIPLKAINSFYRCRLSDIFPKGNSTTTTLESLKKDLF